MKILIIGSKGFVGNNLFIFLKNKNYKVYGADVMVDYKVNDTYFLVDATNADFHSIFEKNNFDACINCSGAASVPDSLNNPLRDYTLNTLNVFKILDGIKKYQPECKFINLSSAAVYGNPQQLPIKEDAQPNLVSPYGAHKYQSEQICQEFHDFFNLKTCSARIFSAYGEGLYKQLFWDLYKKTISDEKIVLFGSGHESRDFIYIGDLVRAIELILLKSDFKAEIVNIANGKEIYIKDAVSIFYGLFENKVNYKFSGTQRKGDPNNWVADISKLIGMGYEQKYSLTEGLSKYYKWIKKQENE